jgi:hypothetical protein
MNEKNNVNINLLESKVEYQRNLKRRLTSPKVQAVEGALTGRHLLQTPSSLYISLIYN